MTRHPDTDWTLGSGGCTSRWFRGYFLRVGLRGSNTDGKGNYYWSAAVDESTHKVVVSDFSLSKNGGFEMAHAAVGWRNYEDDLVAHQNLVAAADAKMNQPVPTREHWGTDAPHLVYHRLVGAGNVYGLQQVKCGRQINVVGIYDCPCGGFHSGFLAACGVQACPDCGSPETPPT